MTSQQVPLIEAKQLRKSYGATEAVRGVSFKVARGEVVGVLGPNGAGKSTTLKMLTSYLRPSGGAAFIGGVNVVEASLVARRMLGYLPENAPLYDDMMVVDFLRFVATLRGVPASIQRARLLSVGQRCGLMEVMGKDIGQLSKGYRQRVGLAQALVHDPDLLILDEPTTGLDPNQIVEIRALIRDLGRDKTVLLSSHILPEVQATCTRVLIIHNGQLVADDTPEGLEKHAAQGELTVTLGHRGIGRLDEGQVARCLRALPGVSQVTAVARSLGEDAASLVFAVMSQGGHDVRQAIFEAAVHNNWVLLGMQRQRVSLEDAFRRLTHMPLQPEVVSTQEKKHAC